MAVLDFPGDIVPLDKDQQGKLRTFLHPTQLLLVCLNDICPRGPPQKPSEPPPDHNQSPEEMFHTFVNKLAQILNFDTNGDTVTALAVILHNGKTTYVFASNNRSKVRLNNARQGLADILNILKSNLEASSKEPDHVIERRLMDKILSCNQIRLRAYLNTLAKELQTSMNRCDTSTAEGTAAKDGLSKIASTLPDPSKKTEYYIQDVIPCIQAIQASRNTPLQRYISARAAEDHNMAKGGSWSNLQHVAGRLLSYQYAVEVLVHAHHVWADTDLFLDFEIESVRSSTPYQGVPSSSLLNPIPETAEMVLNRAPGSAKKRGVLIGHARELEKYNLSNVLQSLWAAQAKKGMKPIVHAEILLHSWLLATEGDVQRGRFFQGWQYIGTSKPMCRMCTEYFANVITTPVRFRAGHPNTYLNWRLPDLYVHGQQKGKDAREKEARIKWCEDLGKMKGRVFAAVERVLEEKVAEWKRWDSNTYTSKVESVKGNVDMLAGWLEGVGL
ncbi:hypothetical protein V8F06_013409 [Rhypophila decipiens]